MSAGLIFSFTYFVAESTARCTSSGCIELMSNSRNDEPAPRQLVGRYRLRWRGLRGSGGLAAFRVFSEARLRGCQQIDGRDALGLLRDLFEGKARDVLRLAVLGDLEVGRLETGHGLSGSVANDDVNGHDLRVPAEQGTLLRLRRLPADRRSSGGEDGDDGGSK